MPTDDKPAECTPEFKLIEESLSHSDYYLKPGSPWGFVVYRVAYGDGTDAKWSKLLQVLAKDVEDDLMSHGKMETMGPRHQLVPMDNREIFEGMTTHDVRKHFRSWVADELEVWLADRRSPEEMNEIRTGKKSFTTTSVDTSLGTRYGICVYVDDSCFDSLDNELLDNKFPGPMIKLVWKDWVPQEPMEEEEIDTEMPPDIDVGWTDLPVREYNWMYGVLCECNHRYDEYCWAAQRVWARLGM
jgi:hypothetical protein